MGPLQEHYILITVEVSLQSFASNRISLDYLGRPTIHSVVQAGLKLEAILLSQTPNAGSTTASHTWLQVLGSV